ncbi:hypothetical protein [Gordonia soli]|uniref:Uncharacterized protein n=1 Tax=Gordonia soli NBRC 108243 TaxID=1223545 RepID=M0QI61_9ACTN|nr:hypothetical protein [Gordonia soli]GAC67981.1 hypothetical protein GS4_11_02520 [Gordonia soli NBRC 108243]
MTFLFAVIGIVAIGFLLWRAFGPQLGGGDEVDTPPRARGPLGPDDDPDFIIDLDRRTRGPNGSDSDDN